MAKDTYTLLGDSREMDQLFVTQLDIVHPGLFDQIHLDRPHLAALSEMKDETGLAGSEQFRVNVIASTNPNGGWYDVNGGPPIDDFDPYRVALYGPKYLMFNVRWSLEQKRVNRGKGMQRSLIKDKIKETIEAIRDQLILGVESNGGGNMMDGLQKQIPATLKASQTTSVGELSPTNSWWRSQARDMSGLSSVTDLENEMLTMWNDIVKNNGKVSYIFTDQTSHETYYKNAREFLFTGPVKIADMTFDLCQFRRKPMMFDDKAPDGEMRFIDKDALKYCVDPAYWMRWTEDKEFPNLPFTTVRQVVCVVNMARVNPRRLGCIFNIAE